MPILATARATRLGVVDYLNTAPLVAGLDQLDDIDLRPHVPSALLGELVAGRIDVALCSSIDYQQSPEPLQILPVGLLACHGPTLTVRLYLSCPVASVTRVHCDTDSHTSVALMRILLRERFGIDPEAVPLDAHAVAPGGNVPQAMLLIGDKVVAGMPFTESCTESLDLGALWSEHTGDSFVFAAWMARVDVDAFHVRRAVAVLDRQRRCNRMRRGGIAHAAAMRRGWPVDLAHDYLEHHILHDFTPLLAASLERFWARAVDHGLVVHHRPLVLVPTAGC